MRANFAGFMRLRCGSEVVTVRFTAAKQSLWQRILNWLDQDI